MNLINKIFSIGTATLATCVCGTGLFINAGKSTTASVVSTDRTKADLKKKYTQCINNVHARYRKNEKLRKKFLDKCEKR
ncbi:hypothetical protein A6V39_04070 [Candidatus Mycoplasma haematobovis]|uniref:Uncharacterized protein n=1 Tax=Candidatus Mycoplasma haematobovis TaxID=432608 RepID=A0A1A9QDN7_9MOLU|nr:hypothetical protein [Candidatus Mycoplasma haematobovis]OAL10065.1 hypothetical protein A6V39_04070 [Candidatus Mycoplasma haematobovis]